MQQMKKHLLFFTVLILTFLMSHTTLKAQIIYTDIDPDITVNQFLQGYGIDFNDDNKIDLHLTLLDNDGVWVMLLIPDSELDESFVVYDGEEASILEYGDDISSLSNFWELGSGWGGLLYGYWENDGEYGNWTGVQDDKYLGIKFMVGSSYYYAWIYLSTTIYDVDDMEFTIQSFAYNSVAEEGISAGDTGQGVGISEISKGVLHVYPNPAQDYISFNELKNLEQITITDISGKQVYTSQDLNTNGLDISHFKSGIYFISAQTDEALFVSKFVKE